MAIIELVVRTAIHPGNESGAADKTGELRPVTSVQVNSFLCEIGGKRYCDFRALIASAAVMESLSRVARDR